MQQKQSNDGFQRRLAGGLAGKRRNPGARGCKWHFPTQAFADSRHAVFRLGKNVGKATNVLRVRETYSLLVVMLWHRAHASYNLFHLNDSCRLYRMDDAMC